MYNSSTSTNVNADMVYWDDIRYGLATADYAPSASAPSSMELSIDIQENKIIGTATMSGSKVTEGTLIVALFDNDDRLIKLLSTTAYTDADGYRTMTQPLSSSRVKVGNRYKVFLFDSLTSARPLTEMLAGTIETINLPMML